MTACPYCREEIADGAVVCRHCGRDQPAFAAAKAARRNYLVGTGLAAAVVVGAVILGVYVSDRSERADEQYREQARRNYNALEGARQAMLRDGEAP